MTPAPGDAVWVRAPARLHLGLFDLRGDLGRRFGGIGVTIAEPSLLLEVRPAPELSARGAEPERVRLYARRFLEHHGIASGANLVLHRAIPAHSGLGSGTQLALAVGRALAELYQTPTDPAALAVAVGRARRSAIGTWAFGAGGFLIEGGRRMGSDAPAPLLARYPMPAEWWCVLAIPDVAPGLSGVEEEAAFRELPEPSAELSGQIARRVLLQMLPALVEGDLAEFGAAVTATQRLVGECFRGAQGGRFADPRVGELIEALLGWGAAGAGQSSWGPAVYGFAAREKEAAALAGRVRERLGARGAVQVVRFDNHGARCGQGAVPG